MILVTGATGLVGSHLLYYLIKEGESVRALYRNPDKLKLVENIFSYYDDDYKSTFKKVQWFESVLNDLPKLTNAFKGIDYVYHCAALVSFDPNQYHELRRSNIIGTANIVNLCVSHNIKKLCFVSSVAAIGAPPNGQPANEETPWNPDADNNVYAITKYGAEMEVWRGTQEGVDAVIINPAIIVGPGFWRSSSGALIKRIYKGLKYYTEGTLAYIDIHDVVKVMIELMKSNVKNERFILVEDYMTFKVFAEKVSIALGVEPPKKKATNLMLQVAWRLDWLNYFFRRRYRKLTKHNVRSITEDSNYNTDKIKSLLDLEFKPIDQSITETCQYFLKE